MALSLFKTSEELWNLAFDYLSGTNGKSIDYAESARLFEKARSSGYRKKGYGPLAYLYYYGYGVDKDPEKAFALCLNDIQNNNEISVWGKSLSQYYIAFCYLEGKGTPKSTENAEMMFKAAADNGHIDSHYRYAKLVYKPVGTSMSAFFTARKYLKVALDNGNKLSRSSYENVKKKYHEWFVVLSDEDCRNMSAFDIHEIAWNFEIGKDTYPKDEEEAQRWYRKAVSLYRTKPETDYVSMCNYAICLHNGLGVEKDLEKAKNLLRISASAGYDRALELLYKWHPEEKEKDILKAADAEDAPLETIIKVAMHYFDKGEYKDAVRYAEKAIEKFESPDGWAIYGAVSEYGLRPYKKSIAQAGKYYLQAVISEIVPIEPKLRFMICDYMFKIIIKDEPEYDIDFNTDIFSSNLYKFIRMCCDDGNIYAKRIRGIIYYQSKEYDDAQKDLDEVFTKTGDLYAAKYLGALYATVESHYNIRKAAQCYKKLIENEFGTREALGIMCRLVLSSFSESEVNTEEYRKYLMKGAEYGNSYCKFKLGIMYAVGEGGFWKNETKAIKLLMDLQNDPDYGEDARDALSILNN